MRLLEPLARRAPAPPTERFDPSILFNNSGFPVGFAGASARPETPDAQYLGFIDQVHRRNGIVSAAVVARALLLSQLRFTWRRERSSGRAGELWGNRDLSVLERPGTSTRPEMLFRLEMDASYSGSAYLVRDGRKLRRLRPDRVTFLLGSDSDPDWDGDVMQVPYDAETVAVLYNRHVGGRPELFLPEEVAVWSPEPDPVHFWRGASWVTSIIREVVTDGQATEHQQKFFENAATPSLVFLMDPSKTPEQVKGYADVVNERHAGAMNAYKNMFLGGGSDVKVVGSTLESLNLKDLTGGLENRVAIRSRVPAVILGAREGLSGSSLNAGNYASARRLLADGWFAPSAQGLCASLETVVRTPEGSELWYDPSEVLFLQEDEKDAAVITASHASTINSLVREGFTPESATEAVTTGDMNKLVHTGLVSVQLQEPGANQNTTEAPSSATPAS